MTKTFKSKHINDDEPPTLGCGQALVNLIKRTTSPFDKKSNQ
jgi:hypothetical protein